MLADVLELMRAAVDDAGEAGLVSLRLAIEDLISTGKSSLGAVDALEQAGLLVKGMLAIFSYGFDLAHQRFRERDLALHTLSNYEYLISQASKTGYIGESQLCASCCSKNRILRNLGLYNVKIIFIFILSFSDNF